MNAEPESIAAATNTAPKTKLLYFFKKRKTKKPASRIPAQIATKIMDQSALWLCREQGKSPATTARLQQRKLYQAELQQQRKLQETTHFHTKRAQKHQQQEALTESVHAAT
ncbi:hypothetical protein U1Q18_041094 [Sarracenia purpurea var. burkii]